MKTHPTWSLLLGVLVMTGCSSPQLNAQPANLQGANNAQNSLRLQALTSSDWVRPDNFGKLIPGVDYVADEVLAIYLDGGFPQQELIRIAAKAGLTYLQSYQLPSAGSNLICGRFLARFKVPKGGNLELAIQRLQLVSQGVGGNRLYGISPRGMASGVPRGMGNSVRMAGPSDWGYYAVNASSQPSRLTAAVIDTGVNNVGGFNLLSGFNYLAGNTNTKDDFVHASGQLGHGTPAANIITGAPSGGLQVGVLSGSSIMPYKACDKNGKCTDIEVAQSICAAANQQASVINLSLGTLLNSKILELAVTDAVADDSVVIAAAGNTRDGTFTGRENFPSYPAAFTQSIPGLVSVGAVDRSRQFASFATTSGSIDLVAPGVDVASLNAYGVLESFSGTSFASPYVTAAALQILERDPGLRAGQVEDLLVRNADTRGCTPDAGAPSSCGAGMVQVR